jgi:hypothetical protein
MADTDVSTANPYSSAMAMSAAAATAATVASSVDAIALQVELDRLREENNRLKNVQPKREARMTDILSWSETRAVWTMRMSNMCNGCIFMLGAVGSFLLPEADTVQSFTRVVLAMYMMCVAGRRNFAGRSSLYYFPFVSPAPASPSLPPPLPALPPPIIFFSLNTRP